MKKSLIAFSFVLLAAIACDKDNNNEPQNYQPQATIVDGDFTYEGTFSQDKPYNGVWRDHNNRFVVKVVNGKEES